MIDGFKITYTIKTGIVLAVGGICIIVTGAILEYWNIRMMGVIVTAGGLISLGNNLYKRIQVKAKEKKERLKQAKNA